MGATAWPDPQRRGTSALIVPCPSRTGAYPPAYASSPPPGLLAYLHLNPVAARLASSVGDARWVAAWWLERAAGLAHREIGALLGASPVLVSRWIRGLPRCERAEVRTWIRRLEAGSGLYVNLRVVPSFIGES